MLCVGSIAVFLDAGFLSLVFEEEGFGGKGAVDGSGYAGTV